MYLSDESGGLCPLKVWENRQFLCETSNQIEAGIVMPFRLLPAGNTNK
jgi:hypothetical protein